MIYIIKKINVDDQRYISSEMIDHTTMTISVALSLLETSTINFIQNEYGRQESQNSNITDINHVSEITEPAIDAIQIYRFTDDPNKLHVYQRKTLIDKISNWTWGTTDVPIVTFKRIVIFELQEYNKSMIVKNNNTLPDPVPVCNVSKVKLPEIVNKPVSLDNDFLSELKKSPVFRQRFLLSNENLDCISIVDNI